ACRLNASPSASSGPAQDERCTVASPSQSNEASPGTKPSAATSSVSFAQDSSAGGASNRRVTTSSRVRESSLLVPPDGLFGKIDVHLFDVEILLDAPPAQLAADAALLVAAPRRLDVGGLHMVHPDDAGAQRFHHAHRAEDVARPDCGGEAIVRVVGDPQRVLFGVERDHARHGPEDFLTRDAVRVVDVIKNRRPDEEAAVEHGARRPSAAHGEPGFQLADLLVLAHAIELLAADE